MVPAILIRDKEFKDRPYRCGTCSMPVKNEGYYCGGCSASHMLHDKNYAVIFSDDPESKEFTIDQEKTNWAAIRKEMENSGN